MVLDVEVYPEMPRKWSKAVSEGNNPVPHQDEIGPDQPTVAALYRMIKERFDKLDRNLERMMRYFDQQDKRLDELTEKMREARQRLAGLNQEARQSRLATEADIEADTKTRKRTENAEANRAKHIGDSSFAKVDIGPASLTSFGMMIEPPALTSRDDALVDEGATAPKPCFSPVEMYTLTAAEGLLPAGTAFTTTRTIFYQPPL